MLLLWVFLVVVLVLAFPVSTIIVGAQVGGAALGAAGQVMWGGERCTAGNTGTGGRGSSH